MSCALIVMFSPTRQSLKNIAEPVRAYLLRQGVPAPQDCQKARSAGIHDRCKAVYEGL
jgi:hypothetical protein